MTLALVFPGQASQEVGMGVDLRRAHPAIDALFDLADQVTGLPIGALCAEGPLSQLTRTDVAQVAVVVTSMASAIALDDHLGSRPMVQAVAGHSVGELTAMWWAGALDTETVLQLVHARGRLMARDSAACDGSMSAVLGLDEEALHPICAEASARSGAHVEVANLNGPGQVVLSGDRGALAIAAELAQAAGARRVVPLTVGGPFHSTYMSAAAEDFRAIVAAVTIHMAATPIILNTTAEPTTDADALRQELAAQVTRPVRWEDGVRHLGRLGCDTFIELGPGQVLTGLIRRILPEAQIQAAGTPDAIAKVAGLAPTTSRP